MLDRQVKFGHDNVARDGAKQGDEHGRSGSSPGCRYGDGEQGREAPWELDSYRCAVSYVCERANERGEQQRIGVACVPRSEIRLRLHLI